MGSYDIAEVCELVGLFILNELISKFWEKRGFLSRRRTSASKEHNGSIRW